MTNATTPYAVVGATGQQGAAVVDHLLAHDAGVRALVRDPDGDAARALAARGVEVVPADQEDPDALTRALAGVRGLFLMTTFAGDDGTEGEVRRGSAVVEAAVAARVPHVVYSSVGGAERHTGIPHFESKRRVEEQLEASGLPFHLVRPTFFMDNLADQLPGTGGDDGDAGEVVLRLPLPGDVPLQMVAVRDIGVVAGTLLLEPGRPGTTAVEIAGDEVTLDQVAEAVGRRSGRPARFEALPLDVLDDDDLRAMFAWFVERPAYRADRAATRALDPDVLDLAGWLDGRA